VSNQTQAPAPAAPETIHIWMIATAVISTILAIPHAIVAFMLDLPSAIVNLHIAITLGFWIGGIVYATSRPVKSATAASEQLKFDALPLAPDLKKSISEVDALEAWLNRTDDSER
jgi:hypothetical protein